ncbi:cryptochrome/photolyase family protein [Pseudoroseomonas globiformis]|uniref:Cryptochrome/photolyase family protein n=1 Tax=Teichococcus globiformis TaxID=2307229 RepID=A0ABV7G2D4_9PROT
MTARPDILWLRQDLRLSDHAALAEAAGGTMLPVYVLDDAAAGRWTLGGASRWWLHHSLSALSQALAERGAPLLLLKGNAETLIPALAQELDAGRIFASRLYSPWGRARDAAVNTALRRAGRELTLHDTGLLFGPDAVRTRQGRPYSIYTPFARAMLALGEVPQPGTAPERLRGATHPTGGLALEELTLLPPERQGPWASAFTDLWVPGEAGAQARLEGFLTEAAAGYSKGRDLPGQDGTSRLSPHLHWGEVSPRQVWDAVMRGGGHHGGHGVFLREILWREFSHHMLWHRPELPEFPLRAEFADFPYRPDAALLRSWQRGRTGYPIVDAGMRQLWKLGWMHNRVRMIAGSLLVKHLLQPWWDGAAWFWDTLVDADLANNSQNWQWIAGCGTDSAPYFRIFNPVLQGRKFDPTGDYVRRFVPELARLPDRWLHEPWEAPGTVLASAGIQLGRNYPEPLIRPAAGRAIALQALQSLRRPVQREHG